jgi:uncharacterized protein
MEVYRSLFKKLKKFNKGRVNVLYGPRRVGKTTLVKKIFDEYKGQKKYVTGDDERIKEVFSSNNLDKIKDFTKNIGLLIIDEAQKIDNVGTGLKILIDGNPTIHVIVTGSASFELAGQIGEPLTGRKFEYLMYPFSLEEIKGDFLNEYELKNSLDELLIYGLYPEIYLQKRKKDKQKLLEELVNSLLLKDILELEKVKSSKILLDLLRMLAYQVGSEVSQTELSNNLNIDYKTIGRYLDLLEKTFIIFSLRGYSRNLRKEITKKHKYYFYDNGIRNTLISNFNTYEKRDDKGLLWENFIISERKKFLAYNEILSNNYFWRTWEQEEVDWIEERGGKLYAFEFNINAKKEFPIPKTLKAEYPKTKFKVITPENFSEFLK